MRTAIVTVTIGEKFKKMAQVTHPTISRYADKIGADFIILDENKTKFVPHFAKLQIKELLCDYDRLIFIDTDIIIRDDAPNLFEVVPENKVGLFREGAFIPRRKLDLEMAAKTYQASIRMDPSKWRGEYWNTGVLVCSKIHKMLFNAPDFDKVSKVEGAWDYGEQGWINLQIINSSTPVHDLDYKFNRMTVMDEFTGIHRRDSYFIHYAGAPEEITNEDGSSGTLNEFIQGDIDAWKEEGPEYEYPRHLLITVGGGLGDQIDAEPVVRFLKEEAYPDSVISVISDFSRVFIHLIDDRFSVSHRKELKLKPGQPYYHMETLPIPESEFGRFISHVLVHSTDYSSLSCLRTTLPNDKKQIKLKTTIEDVNELMEAMGGRLFRDLVLVHPGRGWASKTFPKEYWDRIIKGILDKGLTPCLIGKEIGEDQGLVVVDCPEGCVDLRSKLSLGALFTLISNARVLVSNDSAPTHIAGAFDNYHILIPTCKHPHHIMPWRNGNQYYKADALYKKLTIDGLDNKPTNLNGETVDKIPGGNLVDYLPEVDEVVGKVECFFNKSKEEDTNE